MVNTLTRQDFVCVSCCLARFSEVGDGAVLGPLRWGSLGYYDAFATNGRAALREESGCFPGRHRPGLLRRRRAAWTSLLQVRVVKTSTHDTIMCVLSAEDGCFVSRVGQRLRRCAWGCCCAARTSVLQVTYWRSSQDTRHKIAVSLVSGDALLSRLVFSLRFTITSCVVFC